MVAFVILTKEGYLYGDRTSINMDSLPVRLASLRSGQAGASGGHKHFGHHASRFDPYRDLFIFEHSFATCSA
jgi:hypothetical protein